MGSSQTSYIQTWQVQNKKKPLLDAISCPAPAAMELERLGPRGNGWDRWTRIRPAPADHVVKLQIALKQSQFDELERHLYEGESPVFPYFVFD
ncbi:MAG: hypothetical protein L6R42_007567 [Xanthoria sp. 1 TBL-2021]|nr:MAG: hypothetical protein L6R42_007567 [Xanthoria sp. 1 TBL-2021]